MKAMDNLNINFDISKFSDKHKVGLAALHSPKFPFIGESHGICAIAGYLRSTFSDIQVSTFDLQLTKLQELLNFVKQEKPALLGLSVKLQTFDQLQQLHSMLKTSVPVEQKPVIIVGNAIPNFNGQTILEKYLPDVIVGIGEGELVMGDMYKYAQGELPLEKVRNIYYWKNGQIKFSQKEYLEGKYVMLPDRSNSLAFYKLGGEVYIEGSRGCAYGLCTFCACSDFLGSKIKFEKWRSRPIDLIIEDLNILGKMGIKNVTFADEDFFGVGTESIARAKQLAEVIIKSNLNIHFRINAWVKSLYSKSNTENIIKEKEEVIRLLKDAGLVKVFLGLESGSETQLKRYRKGFELSEFQRTFKLLKKYNIDCEFGFILIDPLMNTGELKEALTFLETNGYIHEISSIYKELRIQVGNSYIDQIREIEEKLGIKLLGEFDFNYQDYKVLKYLDENIQFFASFMRNWIEIIYKLYYVLRIFTQYTEQVSNSNDAKEFRRDICFDTIHVLRSTEFSLLKEFLSLVERKGKDTVATCQLMQKFEMKRKTLIHNLKSILEKDLSSDEIKGLHKEAVSYLQKSDDYINELEAKQKIQS